MKNKTQQKIYKKDLELVLYKKILENENSAEFAAYPYFFELNKGTSDLLGILEKCLINEINFVDEPLFDIEGVGCVIN